MKLIFGNKLYLVCSTGLLTKTDIVDGNINYVGASAFNNGIYCCPIKIFMSSKIFIGQQYKNICTHNPVRFILK